MRYAHILLILIFIFTTSDLSAEWYTQTVQSTGDAGQHCSIALDSTNKPHIAYYDATNTKLMYASWTGSSWSIETVDSSPGDDTGKYCSLAIDTAGTAHIAYFKHVPVGETTNFIKYATRISSGNWSYQTVDSGSYSGEDFKYLTLSLDPNTDTPYISYHTTQNLDLFCATWTGSTWNTEPVDSVGNVGKYNSTSVGLDGTPHISYRDETNTKLKHAKYNGSSWVTETVDSTENTGYWTSIKVNADNHPRIAYISPAAWHLKYAEYNGTTWTITPADPATLGSLTSQTSLSLDSNSIPHVSYYNGTSYDLMYTSYTGTSWSRKIVDATTNDCGTYNSLAIDTCNRAHIAYYDTSNKDLKYMYYNTPPQLSWNNYGGTSYGVLPEICTSTATYTFKVTYTDTDNNPPVNDKLQVRIKKGASTYLLLNMTSESAEWATGELFTASTLLEPCSYYTYTFEAYDMWNTSATQFLSRPGPDVGWQISGYIFYPNGTTPFPYATVNAYTGASTRTVVADNNGYYLINVSHFLDWTLVTSSAPGVGNVQFSPPYLTYSYINGNGTSNFQRVPGNCALSWTGNSGYITDGVDPETGLSTTTFCFKVKYLDNENDAPKPGYPKVRIKKGQTDYLLLSMPSTMYSYTDGIICTTSTLLPPCSYYGYTFESYDVWNSSAHQFLSSPGPDVKAIISGEVKYPDGNPMPGVTLRLTYGLESQTRVTDSFGCYLFSSLDTDKNYTVVPSSYSYYSYNPWIRSYYSPLTSDATGQDFYRVNTSSLTWTGEIDYSSDGLDPELCLTSEETLNYRIKYIDADNDPPLEGYPKLIVLKGTVTVINTQMQQTDLTDTYYIDGKTFYYSTALPSGRDYSYYFVAHDSFSLQSNTQVISGPVVSTSAPQLVWTGETGYVEDGISPEVGAMGTTFYFRIKYVDTDNDPPKLNYPKLHIYNNQTEISGSPYTLLSTGSTDYLSGVIFYRNIPNLPPSLDYSYSFDTMDEFNKSTETVVLSSPKVNTPPVLAWTGETNYVTDGINPGTGLPGTTYYFRIKYVDLDNQTPAAGYPKLHIYKSGTEIDDSPVTMGYVSGIYQTGTVYSAGVVLTDLGTDYTYKFTAYDVFYTTATGSPVSLSSGPVVSNNPPRLCITGEQYYVTSGVYPALGDLDTTFSFRIKYIDPDNQEPFEGYPKLYIVNDSTTVIVASMTYISGVHSTGSLYGIALHITDYGDYGYYFEAQDPLGVSTRTVTFGDLFVRSVPKVELITYLTEATPNEPVNIQAKYTDLDNNPPATGYPKLTVFIGDKQILIASMTYVSGDNNTGAIYSYTASFSTVSKSYSYYCETRDSYGYGGTVKSSTHVFTVSSLPTLPLDLTIFDNNANTTVSSKVNLVWNSTDPDPNSRIIYYLYLGTDASVLKLVYTGTKPAHTLYSLDPGKTYYWYVIAEDDTGRRKQSSVYNFNTVNMDDDKVFNYPNPFNPANGSTNIVFNSTIDGNADIKIFTEFGTLLFQDSYSARRGSNVYPYSGRDSSGNILNTGSYIVFIRIGSTYKKTVILVLRA
ncbi:MAG: hypothetical protein WC955_03950 [Elusimicrobiota bacterium]